MKLSTLHVFVLSVLLRGTFCATYDHAKELRTKLFVTDGYDKKIRPTKDQSFTIFVYVALTLLSIDELSETTGTLKTTGFLSIEWFDELLQWDPSDYGGLNFSQWPQGDVWKPDVALKNSFIEYKELGVSSLNVVVHHDGFIQWYPFQVFQSTCSMNLKYFPFDEQVCELWFVAWSYEIFEIHVMTVAIVNCYNLFLYVYMDSYLEEVIMDWYVPNLEWDVIDTSNYLSEVYASVVFKINMKRKPLHVLLSVIMPIIMLAILNIFVFVLPCESGEKGSYAMTAFLAFAVFLSIISTSFPENSEVVAVFSIYLIIQTIQSTLISLIALLLIRFLSYDDDNTPVPKCLQSALRIIRCIPCRNLSNQKKDSEAVDMATIGQSNNNSEDQDDPIDESPKSVLYSDYSWKEVVKMFDRIFFLIFSLILIISSTTCFVIASGNY